MKFALGFTAGIVFTLTVAVLIAHAIESANHA